METPEKKIPNFIYEDLLFQRRLERTLNAELEKLNAMLAGQVKLLEERKQLLAEIHAAVQQRWQDEEQSRLIDSAEQVEGEARDE
jgi:hypothetical protein